jgi:hypothetical protein
MKIIELGLGAREGVLRIELHDVCARTLGHRLSGSAAARAAMCSGFLIPAH